MPFLYLNKKTGDYHSDMNYEKGLKQINFNSSSKSVIVVDNASYHYVQLNRTPKSSSPKSGMIERLQKNEIPFTTDMCKPELYQLVTLYNSRTKTYKMTKF